MLDKIFKAFKEKESLWKCRWNNESENCRLQLRKSLLWYIWLFLTFQIGSKNENK